MRKLKTITLRLTIILFRSLIVKINGGIWNIKNKLNVLDAGFVKDLLLEAYETTLDKKGSWIGYNAIIEGIPVFPHGITGVFISGAARIGKNCIIYHQVTIGSNTIIDSTRKGSPSIGDSCYIGAGAKIIGEVSIGNNCRIGANCVVAKDMPDNCVAILQPARLIQKENLDNRYFIKGVDGWYYYNNGKFVKGEDYDM
jgi:serine O-acetyltransferase